MHTAIHTAIIWCAVPANDGVVDAHVQNQDYLGHSKGKGAGREPAMKNPGTRGLKK